MPPMTRPDMQHPDGLIPPIVPAHPEFVQAKEKADALAEAFIASPVEILNALTAEIEGMHIAGRFSRTRRVSENIFVGHDSLINTELTEEEHKRAQLLNDVRNVRSRLVILAGQLKDLIMDAEATKID